MLLNKTTINGILNVSGDSIFNNDNTLVSSLNVSGIALLSNNTPTNGVLNVSGNCTFSNITTLIS
jgi:hypothetical protein